MHDKAAKLTFRQRELLHAIRAAGVGNVTRGLFRPALWDAGQAYNVATDRLHILDALGWLRVTSLGPGRKLIMEELMKTTHIAIDPGFGNTKVCADGRVAVLQSAVARPVNVGLAASGMRVAQDKTSRIAFEGFEFIAGAGAWKWGQGIGSMDYAGIVGPERLALMYAGISQVLPKGNLGEVYLVIGLPVPLLQDEAQMAPLLDALRKLKREHCFESGGEEWRLTVTGIKVVSQPAGAFCDWLYNDKLQMREGGGKADVAIVDLGMNTLDLFVMEHGVVRPGFLGGAKVGVRRLLNLLSNNGYELSELDAMLRGGQLKARDAELELWLGEVLGVIERVWPSLKRFTAVIPTGGGAAILDQRLTTALAAKGAAVYWPADPLTANVKGLWKYGIKHIAQRP